MEDNDQRIAAEQIRGAALRQERAESMVAAKIAAGEAETCPRGPTAAPAPGAAVRSYRRWSKSRRCSSAAKAATVKLNRKGGMVRSLHRSFVLNVSRALCLRM